MKNCPDIVHLLVVPRLRVQNANAISSALTHGFPSITAFVGLMWALERRARARGMDTRFSAVGVVCHEHEELISSDGYVGRFRLTRNPIEKDGGTAAIVEEGRIQLTVSVVLAVSSPRWLSDPDCAEADAIELARLLVSMRVAGGSVLGMGRAAGLPSRPFVAHLTGEDPMAQFREVRRRLLPGFALVARDDLLQARWHELKLGKPASTPLDAWLSLSRINWRYEATSKSGEVDSWQHDRTGIGWIVPIPVGYGALGATHPPGTVANARDAATPFRFVESLHSIGQWISPHRLHSPSQLLWYADSRPEAGIYRCRNDFAADLVAGEVDFS